MAEDNWFAFSAQFCLYSLHRRGNRVLAFHIGTPLLGQLSGSGSIQIDFSYIVNMFLDPRMPVKLQN
jgi:hypothetical protein